MRKMGMENNKNWLSKRKQEKRVKILYKELQDVLCENNIHYPDGEKVTDLHQSGELIFKTRGFAVYNNKCTIYIDITLEVVQEKDMLNIIKGGEFNLSSLTLNTGNNARFKNKEEMENVIGKTMKEYELKNIFNDQKLKFLPEKVEVIKNSIELKETELNVERLTIELMRVFKTKKIGELELKIMNYEKMIHIGHHKGFSLQNTITGKRKKIKYSNFLN